ncbi:AraC family transcriptional regulator ligand-binding domain-containing protein [Sphingomonas sp. PL-96]|uniref:AraC family transcriptional regulator n=1 Tax=Sphingomonas sp. PL-96 TaxID=2887201 RepID=UPI001E65DD6B|nr:AraC family transcriptional regulator [Sphingomonas sp. PL-96]MCC2978245.1 AraC family transcriptional regulator ligand-binding domain-containing protein [Sphingomonas sp. PL-96]
MPVFSLVGAGSLRGFDTEVAALGGDATAMLQEVGLDASVLDGATPLVDLERVVWLLHEASVRFSCPDFGMRVSASQGLPIIGSLGKLLAAQPDLLAASEILNKHIALHHTAEHWRMQRHGGLLYVRRIGHCERPSRQQYHEMAICTFNRINRQLGGSAVKPFRVEFSHSRVADPIQYWRHFGCTALFDQEHDCLVYDEDLLRLPVSSKAAAMVGSATETRISAQAEAERLELEVRSLIAQGLGEHRHGIEPVAAALGMGVRTLQRRLAQRHLSFLALTSDVRHDLACWHLEASSMPLTKLANLLGYEDLPTFSKAFRRQTGVPPSIWRRDAKGAAHMGLVPPP